MVKAIKRDAVTEVVVVEPEGVTIELSLEEAQALHSIMGEFSDSGVLGDLYRSLSNLGVDEERFYVTEHHRTSQVGALVLRDRNKIKEPW